ncbi:MAG: nucleotide pyrophosphohydrolase, partial [Promethearchaeota archaeon]
MNVNDKYNDNSTSVSFFKHQVKKFVEERNWRKYHSPKNLVQAINCEAGELSQLLLFKDYKIEEIWS